MRRRSVLRALAALPLPALRTWAQTVSFPGDHEETLHAIGAIVLPSELGAARIREITGRFIAWVREYRPGAEMDHGYGNTRLRNKPASPAPTYLRQLADLQPAMRDPDAASRRRVVTAALENANISEVPRVPDGRHVAADFMAFFFRGSEANDLCYRAAIGRDQCRGLPGSDQPPAELR